MATVKDLPTGIILKRPDGSKYRVPVSIKPDGDILAIRFGFNEALAELIKNLEGAKWNPAPKKYWSCKNSQGNLFRLQFMGGMNPYLPYDAPPVPFTPRRKLMAHQTVLARHALTVHQCIWAAEMGTGKTLAAIEVMEASGIAPWWYVGPKSGVAAVRLEMRKWRCDVPIDYYTYDSLKTRLATWSGGAQPPKGVLFDESSRIKTPTSQRTLAAKHLADAMRMAYGREAYIILMSGTPAPKSPLDWFSQAEVACPGYLREGTPAKFRDRLAVIEQRENPITKGTFPHLVRWRDSDECCNVCGMPEGHVNHSEMAHVLNDYAKAHAFVPGKNEVHYLYQRMKGLVVVQFKKDCMDLPEKVYRRIVLEPSQPTLNAARLITGISETTIGALTLLRELSDGFQYQDVPSGTKTCDHCHGKGEAPQKIPNLEISAEERDRRLAVGENTEELYREILAQCPVCGGRKEVPKYAREIAEVKCPKDDALLDALDSHEDDGRLTVFAGFTGSIDRICRLVEKAGWDWIRVDGRGARASFSTVHKLEDLVEAFQDESKKVEKCVFVAHPASGGMALTLTASDEQIYWSNGFNGEDRMQSEDRFHRPGCRGALITDFIHLPSDVMVLENLQRKKNLQTMSLGDAKAAIAAAETQLVRVA